MRSVLLFLFLGLVLPPAVFGLSPDFVNSIKKEKVSVEDLETFLDINYYKYRLLLENNTEISIVFRDVKNNKFIFNHKVDVSQFGEYVLRLWFRKYDDSLGNALTKENTKINYSLNWNQERAFSGTIQNPASLYEHVYTVGRTYEYGGEIKEKAVLLELYSWQQRSDQEELVAEIYITTAPAASQP